MTKPCWIAFICLGILVPRLSAAEKPNILFIAVDDLRPEIASFGESGMKTPNLDRLAQRGVRFERAYCMVPTCGASRAALMSGIRPARDRFKSYQTRASEDVPGVTTLNSHFKNHGYTTLSLGKVFHHTDDNVDGWSEKPWKPKASTYVTDKANANLVKDRKGRARGPAWEDGGDVPDKTYADGQIARHAVERLGELASSGSPFFLAVGFMKPHLPFVAPGKYFEQYPPSSVSMPDNYFPPRDAPAGAVHSSGELRSYSDIQKKGVLPEAKALELIRGYRAATSYTDAQIGLLLDAYDRLDLGENTIIILWGDHGWNLGEHTMWCKHSCFETSVRSPLIFAGPEDLDIRRGEGTDSLAEFIDIYPTLCDLAGIPLPDHLQGTSLRPILSNTDTAIHETAISRFGGGDTIRNARYRYTIYRDSNGKKTGHMLYDLSEDPGENVNVADNSDYAPIVETLANQLEKGMGKPGDFR